MLNTNFFSEPNAHGTSKEKDVVIPVIEETVIIGKKITEIATIKITKEVTENNEAVDVNLLSDEYKVEHVAINKYADDEAPKARQEGDTLIVPVVREVLVKRLLVVEEIRITKRIVERNEQHNVRLRTENVKVERISKEMK